MWHDKLSKIKKLCDIFLGTSLHKNLFFFLVDNKQSIVNAMNNQSKTTDDSPLWPGYSEMLRGTMGRPPMKMETDLQKRALREWTQDQIKKMGLENDDLTSELQSKVPQIVDMMWQRSVPVQATRDIADLSKKIENLKEIDESKFSDRIKEFEQEVRCPLLSFAFLFSLTIPPEIAYFFFFYFVEFLVSQHRFNNCLVLKQIKLQMMNIHQF